jgi:hypothetical protein
MAQAQPFARRFMTAGDDRLERVDQSSAIASDDDRAEQLGIVAERRLVRPQRVEVVRRSGSDVIDVARTIVVVLDQFGDLRPVGVQAETQPVEQQRMHEGLPPEARVDGRGASEQPARAIIQVIGSCATPSRSNLAPVSAAIMATRTSWRRVVMKTASACASGSNGSSYGTGSAPGWKLPLEVAWLWVCVFIAVLLPPVSTPSDLVPGGGAWERVDYKLTLL